ncbi:hypothetical protein IMSHALPRED_010418 [Imshaugia aleurites]|uniref:PDZ GRASP-type domain-containing protein n=1 Tax=Imshaugia aleurites TaxID=172621 RepID=A0A8H3G733_9LECA|nr:hypothetical protein IMSHALPRED_010418 [Imshaugia aleurites]
MFGALNRFISRLDSDAPPQISRDSYSAFGFQVLRNKNSDIPIEPWYDFVIGINGRQIEEPDAYSFAVEIRNCAGSNVALTIWSAKGQRVRTLQVAVPTPSPTLGLTLQWTPLSSTEDVWHILDVIPDSPADIAGLLPYGDYIVGTPEGNVHGEAGLGELVEDYLSRTLRLWVYNHEYAVTRLVTITPSRSWGGSGALGCVLGFGALHRLPAPLNEPPAGPGETLFETARFSNEENRPSSANLRSYPSGSSLYKTSSNQQSSDLLVPATLVSPPPPPPPMGAMTSGPLRAARKARKAVSPHSAFDEYFKEGEQKSKEEDFTPAAKSAPPPPPKMGEPPPAKSPDPETKAQDEAEEAAS